ncbi:chloroplastic group IIA intron splicing facilitator CRS1 chloroplastic isoform X1 [Tripterygium wilfordii]|uniref:Chloroplastic group IIA intron splicing facilitator CRS1 chloroplastic isoform X1 n=1 Tax=Tripterygium wilfordii TaxID=458696 RepID=A0A7J7CKE3_TRIWF|nr:CRM-domain containing factor CFM3, chloroplastic/mitochondrial-like [Tripterygium wilfordii]KAF5734519.1 chloroplastic group IIA intron splicing facilitator CRS1 chloroplastic isoform X1 [Tripterygium wilfordii]
MSFASARLSEYPLRHYSLSLFSSSTTTTPPNPSFHHFLRKPEFICTCFLITNANSHPKSRSPSAPWLATASRPEFKCHDRKPPTAAAPTTAHKNGKSQNAIERIVLRLRNLGLGSDDEEGDEGEGGLEGAGGDFTGEERLGDLLRRDWVRPDFILEEKKRDEELGSLPWERKESGRETVREEEGGSGVRRRAVKAPTLAELTLEDEELRRLRRVGMFIRERINIPKAGLTLPILQKIHDKWRKEEVVGLKFHEVLAVNMRLAHELVERRTGGLVIWKSGSVMMVYRGSNYEGPYSKSKPREANKEGDKLFVPDVSSIGSGKNACEDGETSTPEKMELVVDNADKVKIVTEEEAEYNSLLDSLGPRFNDWWGTGAIPIDADLLPQKVPGYKTPLRLVPTGMRSRLTNAEMTNFRKLAKSLPCHFALGRNRNHQGLAAAILKLWEKSSIVKIAVKRGIQNTNNKLMADELKNLTGGVLLLRNKYFIVMHRGKDFLPTSVAAVLSEREQLTKQIQNVEEKVRSRVEAAASAEREESTKQICDFEEEVQNRGVEAASTHENVGNASAGTLAEFYEAQARWGRDVSVEEREKMIEEASKAKNARIIKRIEHKLAVAQAKKLRAERLLAKIEAAMIPAGPDYDQETVTDEERVMFRKVGLRMKPYLPLGIRGVFDGVIENMHLHWKHREVVKLITGQKNLAFVEDTARLLEYESGGILVTIERVPKGYAIIYYRGKNYRRPISIRPRNLLTKAKALKRSVAMQRHEALSHHILELEKTIEQTKKEIGTSHDSDDENNLNSEDNHRLADLSLSDTAHSKVEAPCPWMGFDEDDDDEVFHWDTDEDIEFSNLENRNFDSSRNR